MFKLLLQIQLDAEWAVTKTTVSPSTAVMTTTIIPTTEQPWVGQITRVRARSRDRNRSKQSSNGSMPRRALGLSLWSVDPKHFLHIRQLVAAGHSSAPEGARVKVRIGQGQKGPEVTEVIAVDTSTSQVTRTTERRFAPRSSSQRIKIL